jgi:hypothetical protein
MAQLSRQPLFAATVLVVPWLTLASPAWLKLSGVPPAWAVLWLLPWALVEGRFWGGFAGLGLGLLLDSLHPGPVSLLPGLTLLGWWWGRLGQGGRPIQGSLNLGLLALVGSFALGLSLMLQWAVLSPISRRAAVGVAGEVQPALLALPGWNWEDLGGAGLHALLAQTLLTALLAPMLCSLQLLLWRQILAGGSHR